jgi:hypothetical protein
MLALGLVACADFGGVRTIRGDWTGYSLKYLQYAASKGSLATIVSGGAFAGTPESDVAAHVRAELSERPYGVGPIAFVPYPLGETTPALFVSMVFNPAPSFDGWAACDPARAAASGGEPRPDGALRVVAAFCSSQRLLSESTGYAEGLSGLADERFNHLIHLLAMDLFPLRDPNLGVGCDDCP